MKKKNPEASASCDAEARGAEVPAPEGASVPVSPASLPPTTETTISALRRSSKTALLISYENKE